MGEKEDKEKADKLAAAKKRVAQLQKKKKAAANTGDKSGKAKSAPEDPPRNDHDAGEAAPATEEKVGQEEVEEPVERVPEEPKPAQDTAVKGENAGEDAPSEAIQPADAPDQDAVESPATISPPSTDQDASSSTKTPRHSGRQPSVSLQSKIRSTSFRDSGPLNPAAASASLSRSEELEKENKRLAKEAEDHEKRWRRVEEELEELREQNADMSASAGANTDEELKRLRAEIETLRRRNSVTRKEGVHGGAEDVDSLRAELENKDSTIADMQLEISRLRSQLSSQTQGCETHGEQITALQASLSTAEGKLRNTEVELSDVKKALSKASEKAVIDGTERTSKETKIRALERELQDAISQREEVVKKADQLEKKIEAMNKLHREAESRNAAKLGSAEAQAREIPGLRAKVERLESEAARLREKRKRTVSGDGGGDGLDELEDEERQKLERRIRDLEGQVFDLQRGIWRDRRIQMQPHGEEGSRTSLDPAEDFDEVDLSGSGQGSRRRSFANTLQQSQTRHSGFAQVLNSGLAAFRAGTTSPNSQTRHQTRPRNDSLLQDFGDEDAFDENAFAQAQREEEARKMVEHVREVKRGLKQWVGWRLDLVDARRTGAGVGFGEIFEV
ncbi:hypothetical protein A1O3_06389 [Capronia epimyces CBS 606.96]|uniref:M protein repeat protein n=1 Tax=Capronia epimyces CBS 606.96 TaxID=1182542 RepID=W9Y017_9EURO|nr:uncharacterized protein A1O3_06389 [Capronia epimyces CBS 606.96]EXJ82576.1 hypothetical protein A1O3_06389 [Capronia epimyces CBS 606.96]